MAEAEKSRGLKFAERQLRRHGWEHGKGLGRAENGIVDAIKVKVKCDKGGVGHKEGEQFTFHWWDHVFNKASSSLQVESDQDGITLKKTADEDEDEGMISNKKPRKAALAKAKLYGCFVKSSTLLSGQEQPEPKPDSGADDASSSSSSSSDEEEEDRRLDLSSTTQLSDAELMKVCGGRTAHKGARHGLTMSAKLARLEQQDAEFMAKYGGKSRPAATSPAVAASSGAELTEAPGGKRKKQKRSTESAELDGGDRPESPETQPQKKKKKKKQKAAEFRTSPAEETPEEAENPDAEVQKKKKKKKKRPEPAEEESRKSSQTTPEDGEVTAATERRKRKKSKKDKVMMDEDASEEAPPPPEKKKKKKKKCKD
ncbi:G patch domain-containing protein 4 [Cololabis saira]|uniref:G patch domain-containing protein 4 n=1 Tax=Cololabis saira TaxID=129043 RepID=UPI002AD20C75|nr:G patch domain-containing protein 4 [Cololabis saira]